MLFCPFSDSAMQNLDQGGNNGWVKIVFLLVLLLLSDFQPSMIHKRIEENLFECRLFLLKADGM